MTGSCGSAAAPDAGRVFVTGGTGVVGKAVVDRLTGQGRKVIALAHSEKSRQVLEEVGTTAVTGDVLDRSSLVAAMRSCDVAYHLAGVNALCLRDPSSLFRVNVIGSRNIVEAAAEAGLRRVVFTSSAATIGEQRGEIGREDGVHRGWFLSDYERSKFEAEQTVMERGRILGLDVVSVNPASVQGPGRADGTAKLLIDFLNGRIRFVVPTRLSLVDIADCAQGHLLAETEGKSGERYILSGASLRLEEAMDLIERITGVKRRPRSMPVAAASAAGAIVEVVGRLRGRNPPLCREMVRTLVHGHTYDGTKAERELGLSYTPVEETLRRTITWLIHLDLVPSTAATRRLST